VYSKIPKPLSSVVADDTAVVPKYPLPKLILAPALLLLHSIKGNQNFAVSNPVKVGSAPVPKLLVVPDKFLNTPSTPTKYLPLSKSKAWQTIMFLLIFSQHLMLQKH
jgi:hypothetical protein